MPDLEPEQLEVDWQARLGQFLQQQGGGTMQQAYVIRWALKGGSPTVVELKWGMAMEAAFFNNPQDPTSWLCYVGPSSPSGPALKPLCPHPWSPLVQTASPRGQRALELCRPQRLQG